MLSPHTEQGCHTQTVSACFGSACTSTAIADDCSYTSGMRDRGFRGEKKETRAKNKKNGLPLKTRNGCCSDQTVF